MNGRMIDQEKLLGIIVAFIISLIAWIVTRDPLSSLLIGLVTELIALMLELHTDLTKTRNIITETLSISEAAATHQSLKKLISDYDYILREGNPLFKDEVERVLLELTEKIGDLKRGHMTIRSYEDAYLRAAGLLNSIRKEALFTDIVTSSDKWSIGEVQMWHRENIRAAGAGLQMTRVFIVKNRGFLAPDSPLVKIMKEQQDAGINSRYATFDELDPNLIRDTALWDDQLAIKVQFTPTGLFGLVTLDMSPTVVNDTRDYFKRIIARSHPFSDLES